MVVVDEPAVQTETRQYLLDGRTKAEVISAMPRREPKSTENFLASFLGGGGSQSEEKPTLVFIHGSFHASWCWEEHYMPYFASQGYPCVALSLQGTGGTQTVEEGARKVKISCHTEDLDALLRGLSDGDSSLGFGLGKNPQIVLLGHSFGGLTIMKWLEKFYESEKSQSINLAGVGLMCSVPPSGNGPMTMRYLWRSLSDAWAITAGFVLKRAIADKKNCRELFFGGDDDTNGIMDDDIERYQSYFERDTVATIDLSHLSKVLPSKFADGQTGEAPFADRLPPSLVLAASDDFIVDMEGSEETARYFGLASPTVVESPHDIMLGRKWQNGADAVLGWLKTLK